MHKLSIVITLLVFVTSCIGNRRSNELENKYSKLIQNSNRIYSQVSNINYSTIEQRSKSLSYGDRIIDIKEISLRLKVKTQIVIDSVERYSGISKKWSEYSNEVKQNYVNYLMQNDTLLSLKLDSELNEFVNTTYEFPLSKEEVVNSILQLESKITSYLVNRVRIVDNMYYTFSVLASTDRAYYRLGDSVKVQVGIGSYSDAANPTFEVAGITLKKENGYGLCVLSANRKGKHIIPIRIMYDSLDAGRKSFETSIEYVVE